jgi:SAM-dependent methyltransferase
MFETGALHYFARDLSPGPAGREAPAGTTFREAHDGEIAALLGGSDPHRTAAALAERFRRGDRCFVVEAPNGAILHTRWISRGDPYVPELRRRLRLAPGTAYFFDGFTRREARGHGLDAVARAGIFATLRSEGLTTALSYVRADNPTGLRAAARAQRECGRLRYFRLGRELVLVAGARSLAGRAGLVRRGRDSGEERAARERRWRHWFESWLAEAPERRSTGFDALPAEYFAAMSGFVAEALALEPARDSVLDVGCDSAMVSRGIAPRCRKLTGVDFVPGLLWNAPAPTDPARERRPDGLAAADGRRLPFPSAAFDKVYCLGTIHTLPSREDAFLLVEELVRVCAPGGRVLVGAVPDRARRWRARREVWRQSGFAGRLRIVAALLGPERFKPWARRMAGAEPGLVYLDFDLRELARRLAPLAVDCRELPFGDGFWSRDFRVTRSNLLISVPAAPIPAAG